MFFGRLLKIVGLVAVIGIAFASYHFVSSDSKLRMPQPPEPNGYDVFLDAAQLLKGELPDELNSSNTQLRVYVENNRKALEKLREGLLLESRVVMDFQTNVTAYSQAHLPELSSLKRLARTLAAEGLVASSENRFSDAMTSFLNCIRLGQKCSNGGPIIDRMVGIALENLGIKHAGALVKKLNAQQCRDLIRSFEAVNEQAETFSDTLANEKLYARGFFGWRGRIGALVAWRSLKAVKQNFISKAREHDRVGKQFILETAIRAFTLEKGTNPDGLIDLIPDYLKELPRGSQTQAVFDYDKATGSVTVRMLTTTQVD